jgi:hypothetical protein
MASTDLERWARVRGVRGMHLPGSDRASDTESLKRPPTAAAHMRDDIWLEVDGRVQWFGRARVLEIRNETELEKL